MFGLEYGYEVRKSFQKKSCVSKSLQIQNSSNARIILTKDGGYFLLSANMAPPCGHSIKSLAFPWLSLLRTVIS